MKRKTEDPAFSFAKYARVTTRVVLNKCHGGFGLSDKAKDMLMKTLGFTQQVLDPSIIQNILAEIPRHHPALLYVVEQLGKDAWVPFHLDEYIHRPIIVEIPVSESDYEIVYRDGWEIAVPKNFETPVSPN
jgi:hypothetical protein